MTAESQLYAYYTSIATLVLKREPGTITTKWLALFYGEDRWPFCETTRVATWLVLERKGTTSLLDLKSGQRKKEKERKKRHRLLCSAGHPD